MVYQKILVVEPNDAIRALLAAVARRNGVAVDCAADRTAAVDYATSGDYAAYIVEPRVADGAALLRDLHGLSPTEPKIVIATTPDASSAALAVAPGVRTILLKPFRLEELESAIMRCCTPVSASESRRGDLHVTM